MTGLKNRTVFTQLSSFRNIRRVQDGRARSRLCRLNGFKAVNDSIGHQGGDELVKVLAGRSARCCRPRRLARIGGDEFAVVLPANGARQAPGARRRWSRPRPAVHRRGFEFHVTAASAMPSPSAPSWRHEVLRRADLAMYQAKNGAEREAVAYHATMETGALEKKQIETALRRAIENGELRVFYQPVVRAGDLTIVGCRGAGALDVQGVRPVSPALFIPVAEETGLIHEIGRFVVDQGLPGPAPLAGPQDGDQRLARAAPRPEFRRRPPRHGRALRPAAQFELELTEGILVYNPTIAKRKLAMLKEFGFSLSLDDFGTGFSSIGYLRQFPFDILKVDRSFVRESAINPTANALIQSLVSLGDAIDLDGDRRGHRERRPTEAAPPHPVRISAGLPDQQAGAGRGNHRDAGAPGPERPFKLRDREPERRVAAS